MHKAIGTYLAGATLLGVFQVLESQFWNDTQTTPAKQSASEINGRSGLAQLGTAAVSEPVTVVVTLPPARSLPKPHATPKPSDRVSLARTLQSELQRVGCYAGEINGDWNPSTRNAMKDFTVYVNARLPVDKPDMFLLSLIQGHEGKACDGSCPPGQSLRDGQCIQDALIAVAKKPAKAAPLITQTVSRPAQTTGSVELNADSNQPLVAPQPAKSPSHQVRVRNATGQQRVRSFGSSIFATSHY